MRHRPHFTIVAIALASAILGSARSAAADSPSHSSDLVPDNVFAALQFRHGRQAVSSFRQSAFLKTYLAGPMHAALSLKPEFMQLRGGVYMFAGMTGLDPWTLAGHVLGEDVTVAIGPRAAGGEPYVLAVMKADDDGALQRVFNGILGLSGLVVGEQADGSRSKVVSGVRGYELNKGAYIARFDGWVVFCNDGPTLERVIAERATSQGKLSSDKVYARAAKMAPAKAPLWGFVNVRAIRAAAGEKFDKRLNNALGAALLAGWVDAFRSADAAAVWIDADDDAIEISARLLGGKRDGESLHVAADDGDRPTDWTGFHLPGQIARLDLSRDWFGLWEARESMLDPNGLRDLASFAGTVTTLMGNLDFSSEFLAGLRPTWRLFAARQTFAEGRVPTPELPGFALLLHLKSPKEMSARLENAAMMAMSMINLDRGQKMQPQFQMNMDRYNGARILSASFAEQTEPGPRGMRYNFEPAFAAVADHFVLCTSRRMLEHTIDALKALPRKAKAVAGGAADSLQIDLSALRQALEANREVFIANRMLEQDEDRATASRQVSIFLDVLKFTKDLSVTISPARGGMEISARISLNVR